MNLKQYSFSNLFESKVANGQEEIQLQKIVIPSIQRDYAQGRINPDVDRIRNRFLQSLHDAIVGEPITLDFVYGDLKSNGELTPLDGQQRLTTLYLLHWYAAKKANLPFEEYSFLLNFGYDTRPSSRDFCEKLVMHNPSFDRKLSEEVKDQAWFPFEWLSP